MVQGKELIPRRRILYVRSRADFYLISVNGNISRIENILLCLLPSLHLLARGHHECLLSYLHALCDGTFSGRSEPGWNTGREPEVTFLKKSCHLSHGGLDFVIGAFPVPSP